jgi:Ca2+-transporting ATPase
VTIPLTIPGASEAELFRRGKHSRRIRLRIPALRHNAALARAVENAVRGLAEVASVKVDERSGSVLILTRGDRVPALLLQGGAGPVRRPPDRRWRLASLRGRETIPSAEWHALPTEDVLARLASTPTGLESADARRRLRRFGANALDAESVRSRLAILASQLTNVPSALLLGSSALSTLLGELVDAAAIVTVVALNAGIGYVVERTNETLIASWRRAEAGEVEVLRDGRAQSISSDELVPGDVVEVHAGDVVAADARVLTARRLSCDEAPLTGESEPQSKHADPVPANTPLAERASLLFAGTTVASGHGRAVVIATGASTEMARVRTLIEQSAAPPAPLARRLDRLSNRVARLSMLGAGVSAAAGLLHGRRIPEVLRGAVALGVAALPEGLPVVSTAALVRSMSRMRRKGMVVRRLSSAETLGGVTVICTDKTGTLTQNRMQLEIVDFDDGPRPISTVRATPERLFDDAATLLLAAGLLNSEVEVHRRGHEILSISGSSTERALVLAAIEAGLDLRTLQRQYPTRMLLERSSGVHYVVSVHGTPGGDTIAFVKGAPEQVVERCARRFDGTPLDEKTRAALLARNDALAAEGLRVLAIAWRPMGADDGAPQDGFTWLGMVGLRDPLRPGAADAIAAARRAGIRTVIVTGDQRRTAEAIARQLGLDGETVDGADVAALARSDAPDDRARLRRLAVVSRVTPADKLAVVEALRRAGEIVGMAGDGINDAPALKVADVGIAVGRNATDLARHVADVVLAGDDLRSILAAVAEGRIVQDNLRRAVRFLFATNFSELALVIGAALVGARDPLTPLQLLWINLLTDTLPALALALEPGDPSVLDRPPAPPGAPILGVTGQNRVLRDGAWMAITGGAATLVGGRGLGFGVLSGVQLAYTVQCRAAGTPWSSRFRGLVGGTVLAQAGALGFPPLQRLLAPGASVLPLGGFALGFTLPWLMGRLSGGEVIVRTGRYPTTATVTTAACDLAPSAHHR